MTLLSQIRSTMKLDQQLQNQINKIDSVIEQLKQDNIEVNRVKDIDHLEFTTICKHYNIPFERKALYFNEGYYRAVINVNGWLLFLHSTTFTYGQLELDGTPANIDNILPF